MSHHRDIGQSDLQRLQDRKAALDAEILAERELPQRLLREQDELMNTLPPSADVDKRRKEIQFDDLVSRSVVTNQKREITRSLWIMVLLIIAALVMLWWAYSALKRYQIL